MRDAALGLAPPDDDFRRRLRLPAPPSTAFRCIAPRSSAFFRPASLDECFALLAEHPEREMVAGARIWGGIESALPALEQAGQPGGVAELREFRDTAVRGHRRRP